MLALIVLSCSRQSAEDIVATVNGEAISARQLESELAWQPRGVDARQRALEDLIDEALVLQEAGRIGAAISPDELENQLALSRAGMPAADFSATLKSRGLSFDAWKERIRRRSLFDEVVRRQVRAAIVIKPQDLKDYYWEHVTRFRRSESVHLLHILCSSRSEAEKALSELRLGEAPDEVARRYSRAPEAASGGDMGWVERRQLPEKLARAAFALKAGKYSDIIASQWGWHILYLVAKKPAEVYSLEASAPEILQALTREREQPLYRDWLAALRSRAEIQRFDTTKGTP